MIIGGGINIGNGITIRSEGRGTLQNPGVNAVDIYNSGGTSSGWYYIQTSTMASPLQVYCNMTDQGGGWMLISYNPNDSAGGTTGIIYPNLWTNGQGTLNRLAVKAMDLWYHNGSAQCSGVMKMATTVANQTPLLANMTIANKVVYSNPSILSLSTVNPTALVAGATFLNGTWSPVKGHTQMTTNLTVTAPSDWLYQANSWWTVCGPSTDTATLRSGNAQGTGSWTNPTTSNIYGVADVAAAGNSGRTDLLTYAVYIK